MGFPTAEGLKTMKLIIVKMVPIGVAIALFSAGCPTRVHAAETGVTARQETAIVQFPKPRLDGGTSVERALLTRRYP